MKPERTKYSGLVRLASVLVTTLCSVLTLGIEVGLGAALSRSGLWSTPTFFGVALVLALPVWWAGYRLHRWIESYPCSVIWRRETVGQPPREEVIEVGEWYCCCCQEARRTSGPHGIGRASVNGQGGQIGVYTCPECGHARCCDE